MKKKTSAVLAVLAVACAAACNKNANPTPAGVTVLEWTLARSDRASMKDATLSNKQTKDLDYVDEDTGAKVKLHVETAIAKFKEDGKDVEHDTVSAIAATVVDGKDFTFADHGCHGPNYPLSAPGSAPRTMMLDCSIGLKKPRYDGGIFFQMIGDGTILPRGKSLKVN